MSLSGFFSAGKTLGLIRRSDRCCEGGMLDTTVFRCRGVRLFAVSCRFLSEGSCHQSKYLLGMTSSVRRNGSPKGEIIPDLSVRGQERAAQDTTRVPVAREFVRSGELGDAFWMTYGYLELNGGWVMTWHDSQCTRRSMGVRCRWMQCQH